MLALWMGLALVWVVLSGDARPVGILTGFVLGWIALIPVHHTFFQQHKKPRLVAFTGLALVFIWELIVSSLRIAWDVITPGCQMSPRILELSLPPMSDTEITLLTSLITLTPGTLSLDLSEDRRRLWFHAAYADHPDQLLRNLERKFLHRILEVMR